MKTYPKPHLIEKEILKSILDYLKAEGIWHLRLNAGLAWKGSFPMRQAPAGTPDIMLQIPGGRPILNPSTQELEVCSVARICWIEAKRPGGKMTEHQFAFRKLAIDEHAIVWLVDNLEELRRFIPPKREIDFHQRGEHVTQTVETLPAF